MRNGYNALLDKALERGAAPDATDERGETPSLHAARTGNHDAVVALARGGARRSQLVLHYLRDNRGHYERRMESAATPEEEKRWRERARNAKRAIQAVADVDDETAARKRAQRPSRMERARAHRQRTADTGNQPEAGQGR